jgi:hypothetical protein
MFVLCCHTCCVSCIVALFLSHVYVEDSHPELWLLFLLSPDVWLGFRV